jgi:ATP-dependent protease ClpP protease subunit
MAKKSSPRAIDVAVIGDVDDWEEDVVKALLEAPHGAEVTFHIDSAGGSVFGALAVLTLMKQRNLRGTAIVLGECSSATILLLAGCPRRLVTPYSTLLFHRMRWQSEKRVSSVEASHWARHFEQMENDIDELQIRLFGAAGDLVRAWTAGGQYVTGPQLVAAGLAEMVSIG